MTSSIAADQDAGSGVRSTLAVGGILALIVGFVILVWPSRSAVAVTAIIAVYAIVAGLAYAGIALFTRYLGNGWARLGYAVLGVLFVIAGVIAFANLGATTVALAVFLGVLVGILWIVEGVVALTTLSTAASSGWTIVFAIVSILAGITLLFSPFWGAATLWWLIGIGLLVLGLIQIVRAITIGRAG